ncbi:unnamed protein product [Staurois parvus]|uniref:Uncharacterized protein n=1 Tax=Staurois parvus TaxID=386267 RepID=A0ABN9EJB3_9NEOB|nr:unnamed protein product [Staurois parvus]
MQSSAFFFLHQKLVDSSLHGFQWHSSHQCGQFQCGPDPEKKVEHAAFFSALNCTGTQ